MTRTVDPLKQFITAPKPDWCSDTDVIVMAYLLATADATGTCAPKQIEICCATGVNCNSRTLRRTLLRLQEHGWITWLKVPAIGARHAYEVHFERLPRKEADGKTTP
jgi:hypothetical protein